MNRTAVALAAALALLPAAAAPATSITAAPPHDPKLGCRAIAALVANFNAGRLLGRPYDWAPIFYSDRFGEVEIGEEADFLHALRHSEGRPDRAPMRLHRAFVVDRDEFNPIYLVVLERESWHETRFEDDDSMDLRTVRDPHYERDTSHWLATFSSNDVTRFREAPEMYPLGNEANRLKHCGEDQGAGGWPPPFRPAEAEPRPAGRS